MPVRHDTADPIDAILRGPPPRATAFIVTIYGDVAEPRGGTLWMGTLVEVCAVHGISESLARTAVSRLVASGRLEGVRDGRRSYYRLTDAAGGEFRAAARLFYDPPREPEGWRVVLGAGPFPEGVAAAAWARPAADIAIAPDRADLGPVAGAQLASAISATGAELRAFAARHWDLEGLAQSYRRVLCRFGPLADALQLRGLPDGATCLALRLRLVHAYRQAVLADPLLPRAAVPQDWPAPAARRLFASLYLALARKADGHVAASLRGRDAFLPMQTEATARRLSSLAAARDHLAAESVTLSVN